MRQLYNDDVNGLFKLRSNDENNESHPRTTLSMQTNKTRSTTVNEKQQIKKLQTKLKINIYSNSRIATILLV